MKKASEIAPKDSSESLESSQTPPDDHMLDSIRSILLAGDREQINALAAETAALEQKSQKEKEELLQRIKELQEELEQLQELNSQGQDRANKLQGELDHVRQDMVVEQENRLPFLIASISNIISQASINSRASLARALSPVMGEAIRNQILESQDEMIDAISPILLRTIQKALADFARDLQRNIDARLKTTLGLGGILRSLRSRMRGVEDSDILLRESLPFAIDELFLIQRDSGLLIDYDSIENEEAREKELIGGMLTAIRDFARDSFGDASEEELDEIQYGDERIIIEGGTAAYIAAVIRGVDPPGFRSALRDFVAEQHLLYGEEFRRYSGDLQGMPDFKSALHAFRTRFMVPEAPPPKPMTRGERLLLAGGALGIVLFLALACFYLQFTIALLPVAFGNTATPTSTSLPTLTMTTTAVPTLTPTATGTNTPTYTPSPTTTHTMTPSPSPSPSSEPTATPTNVPPVPTLNSAIANGPVWVRQEPDQNSALLFVLLQGSEVKILNQNEDWLEIEIMSENGPSQGWVPLEWIDIP